MDVPTVFGGGGLVRRLGAVIDLLAPGAQASTGVTEPEPPGERWARLTTATAHLSAPLATIDFTALRHNALDMTVRCAKPIRVASKSVRVRDVLDAVLRLPGYRGVLAYTLPEALWLAEDHDDIVLGYPTTDRNALERLCGDDERARRITLMIDGPDQLDLVDSVVSPRLRPELRVAIDVDASWRAPGLGHLGVRRSPIHTPAEAAALAAVVSRRAGFRLVGLQMYEAQIAGQTDRTGTAQDGTMRWMKARSGAELRIRRAAVVAAVSQTAPLEFVTGGGTGSLEYSAADSALTEVTAGSGLLGGHLFDHYRAFRPQPAAAFALDVVRRPAPELVTVLGGGWIASGPPLGSRQPEPVWPAGLRMLGREGAGEVQTPLQGKGARELRIGDRVWFRHAKSGELSERVDRFQIVDGDRITGDVPTYRGEGHAFL